MKAAHILRKYNPNEWGGTETLLVRLLPAMQQIDVSSIIYAPKIKETPQANPFSENHLSVKRFSAFLPVLGLKPQQRERLISVGGNLFSFDLPWKLYQEPNLEVIHLHTTNRLGGLSTRVAKLRNIPLIVSIHGGQLDVPEEEKENIIKPLSSSFEWGKFLGWTVRSRHVLQDADAIITYNPTEQTLLQKKFPKQEVLLFNHPINSEQYQIDQRSIPLHDFPDLHNRKLLLCIGRIDPQKNQLWLIEQMPTILSRWPEALLLFVGSSTNVQYMSRMNTAIQHLKLENNVKMVGAITNGSPLLIGLTQLADVLILPSISEPFGIVILEAWAAGTPVISNAVSGPKRIMTHQHNGLLFEIDDPLQFYNTLDNVFNDRALVKKITHNGKKDVIANYHPQQIAKSTKELYEQLKEEKIKQ